VADGVTGEAEMDSVIESRDTMEARKGGRDKMKVLEETGPRIPEGTCIIEVNSLHTISLWTRSLQDVRDLESLIPYPAIAFFYISEHKSGYYCPYFQLLTQYSDGDFIPSISTIEIGEQLEARLPKTERYTHNCGGSFLPWVKNSRSLFGPQLNR
jgi:hypothetical protein